MTKFLKVDEYAAKFRISRITVYRLIKAGKNKYRQIGSRYILPVEETLPVAVETKRKTKPEISPVKTPVELLLDKISPEIMKTFSSPPEFGSVKVEVFYHQGVPVKIDCGKTIKQNVP